MDNTSASLARDLRRTDEPPASSLPLAPPPAARASSLAPLVRLRAPRPGQEPDEDESKPTPLLVLGLGNLLCGDDGLGSAAVARLDRDWEPPEGALVFDGGTLGLALLPYIEDARDVILVDAVGADEAPGALVLLEGEDVAPAVRHRLSPHQVGVADLLDGARLHDRYPERLVLVGLVPATISLGVERSPSVESRLPRLVEEVVAQAGRMGHVFRWRTKRPSDSRDRGHVARVFGL